MLTLHDIRLLPAETWGIKELVTFFKFEHCLNWSQKRLKTNWTHFFEYKERPQYADI